MVEPIDPSDAPRPGRVDELTRQLLDAVLDGRHPPGSVLPPERELAEQLGANRTSLRQALTRLAQMGVIASHQGRGTVVLDLADATDPVVVGRLVERGGPALLGELLEVRQAMGALAGRLAAVRATDVDRAVLGHDLQLCREAADAAQLQRRELAFFATLIAAARNRPLRTLLRWVERADGGAQALLVGAFEDRAAVLAGLEAIEAAVRAADPDGAARAMERYAAESAARIVRAVTGG